MFKSKLNTNDVYILGKDGPMVSSASKNIVPTGTKTITENGTGIDVASYAYADVAVPGIVPSGTYSVTENGTYDIANYANVSVSVSGGGGGLPSNMQIVDVSITEDVTSITVPYDNTRSVAMLFVIPDMIQDVAYEITFMMAKRNFYTKEAALNQTYGTALIYNHTIEQPYTGSNIGSVTVDSTNATITINGKGGKYVFKNGVSFHVIIVYGIIE